MGSGTATDPFLAAAVWTGAVTFALTLVLILQIGALRGLLILRERRRRRFAAEWQPFVTQVTFEDRVPRDLPTLHKRDIFTFLNYWNSLHDSLRGAPKEKLNVLARRLRLDRTVWKMLHGSRVRERLIAIVTLGHLRDYAAWDTLLELTRSGHPLESIVAARALVHIDGKNALPLLLPLIRDRNDWPPSKIASILRESGPDVASGPLIETIRTAPPAQAARLLRYLDVVHTEAGTPLVLELLGASDSDQVIAACLQVLRSPAGLESVRRHTRHPQWFVRVQAASALGRLGTREDMDTLVAMLGDREWWVRYRAAQALARLPFADRRTLEAIRDGQQDRYARDILAQVIAETRPA